MRWAELVMAVVMAVFSLYLMIKSAELPIGWIKGAGPGGGAFPFWLAVGMLACCAWNILAWFRKTNPFSRSDEPYMDRATLKLFLVGAGSLTVMVGLFQIIGVYATLPLFLIFYMRVLGGHSWALTGSFAAITPVIAFLFFEITLNITLPKGYSEPLFYPLYEYFY